MADTDKDKAAGAKAATADATATVEPAEQPRPTRADQERGYVTGTWGGHEHFACLDCPYDTFDEVLMQEHQDDQTQQKLHEHIARGRR
jgi:hypothetical protein